MNQAMAKPQTMYWLYRQQHSAEAAMQSFIRVQPW